MAIPTGAVDWQVPISPTVYQVISRNGRSKNAKAKDKRAANLQAQAIGMRVTVMTTVDGMICKAVEVAMITADG